MKADHPVQKEMPKTKIVASEYPIHSVTVFKSFKAEVVRTIPLELKAGLNKIEITALPTVIDTQSVRVSGLGDARLFDVVCTVDDSHLAEQSNDTLIRLNKEKESLEDEVRVREEESTVLSDYAKTLNGQYVAPSEMSKFLASFVAQRKEIRQDLARLQDGIATYEREIAQEERKAELKQGSSQGVVTAVLIAEEDGPAQLKLTYIVTDASWHPTYELHATTDKGKPASRVSLHYRARIQQRTGEDWSNTSLTLSTVTSDVVKTIPELQSMKIQEQRPEPQYLFGAAEEMMYTASFSDAAPSAAPPPPPPARRMAKKRMVEPNTVVSSSPLAVSYTVEGKSSLPSDGLEHQVTVSILPFEAQVTHLTVPRLDPQVYLQCEVKNISEYRLLPGPVNVILDDSLVSKTYIQDINTGDKFSCNFGADPATRVTYTRTSTSARSAGGTFAEAFDIITHTSTTVISNKHSFPIPHLIVRDVVPLAEDKRVRVILRKPAALAEAKDGEVVEVEEEGKMGLKVKWADLVDEKGGEKEGKFEWLWAVEANSQVTLVTEWEVKVPGEGKWIEV